MRKRYPFWLPDLFSGKIPNRLLVRVDAGRVPGLSFGHLSRCADIVSALNEDWGCEAVFLIRNRSEALRYLEERSLPYRTMPWDTGPEQDASLTKSAAEEIGARWILLDVPYGWLDSRYIHCLLGAGFRVAMLDDSRFDDLGATSYLNSSILAPERMSPAPNRLLGPDWLPFRIPEKSDVREPATKRRPHVALTFGGSDPTGLTTRVVEALAPERSDVRFTLVLGPGYEGGAVLRERLADAPNWFVTENPPSLPLLLSGCDLVVCSGGRTMYEAHCMGIPFLPVGTAPHEEEAIEAFHRAGLASQRVRVWNPDEFISQFNLFLESQA